MLNFIILLFGILSDASPSPKLLFVKLRVKIDINNDINMKLIILLLLISILTLNLTKSNLGEGEASDKIPKSKIIKFNMNKPWDEIIEEKMNMCAEHIR
jgi:hypothetical protein